MFETLKPTPPDKIIELIGLYKADPRTEKIDLGIGVYKDARGRTPVMRAVKAAERRLVEEQETKAYVGVAGDLEFVSLMGELALGDAVPADRLAGVQTPGGTGAVRQLFELDQARQPRRDGLALRPDLAEPPGDPRLPRHARPHLPLLRRRHPRRRLRRHDGRPGRAQGRRRPAAARLLPQPDRRQPRPRAVARGHRASSPRSRRGADDRPRLPGLRRRARRRRRRAAPHGGARCRS